MIAYQKSKKIILNNVKKQCQEKMQANNFYTDYFHTSYIL